MTTIAPQQTIATKPEFKHLSTEIIGETSVTYDRTDGWKVEMVVVHPQFTQDKQPELILATGTPADFASEDNLRIVFSKQEILLLRQLLISKEVSDLLEAEQVVPASVAQEILDGWQQTLNKWEEARNQRSASLQQMSTLLFGTKSTV